MTSSSDIEHLSPIKADPADPAGAMARLMNAKLGTDVKPDGLRDFVFSYWGTLSLLAREIYDGERK